MREVVPFVLAATLGLGRGWGMYSYLDNKDSNRPIVRVQETGEHLLAKVMASAHNLGMDMDELYLEAKGGVTPSLLDLERSAESLEYTLEKYRDEVLTPNQSITKIGQGGKDLLNGYNYDRNDHDEYVYRTCTDSDGHTYDCGYWQYDYSIHTYTFDRNTVLSGINHIREGKKSLTTITTVPLREIAQQIHNIEVPLEEWKVVLENYQASNILTNHSQLRSHIEQQKKATSHEQVFSEIDTFRNERYRRSSRHIYEDRIPPGFELTQRVGTAATNASNTYRALSGQVNALQKIINQVTDRQFTPKMLGEASLEVYKAIGEKTVGRMSGVSRGLLTAGTGILLGVLGGFGGAFLAQKLPHRSPNYTPRTRTRRRTQHEIFQEQMRKRNERQLRENVRKRKAQEARRRAQERQEKKTQPVPKPDVSGRRTLKDLLEGLKKDKPEDI